MAGKALYVLAGYDDRTEKTLAGMQEKLYKLGFSGVQTKNIPMHFTLGSYPTDQEEALKERLRRIADTREAFDVSFNHVGLFRLPENDVLFIKPEAGREMPCGTLKELCDRAAGLLSLPREKKEEAEKKSAASASAP